MYYENISIKINIIQGSFVLNPNYVSQKPISNNKNSVQTLKKVSDVPGVCEFNITLFKLNVMKQPESLFLYLHLTGTSIMILLLYFHITQ